MTSRLVLSLPSMPILTNQVKAQGLNVPSPPWSMKVSSCWSLSGRNEKPNCRLSFWRTASAVLKRKSIRSSRKRPLNGGRSSISCECAGKLRWRKRRNNDVGRRYRGRWRNVGQRLPKTRG